MKYTLVKLFGKSLNHMQNKITPILTTLCLLLSACTTELLHSELAISIVPETAIGAQPYYTQASQARPVFTEIPDTLTIGKRIIGNYLTTILPYHGVAIWKVDSSAINDTLEVGFLRIDGLLDYSYRRNDPDLIISQQSAHYSLDLGVVPPSLSGPNTEPKNFAPYRFLARTLGISGYINGQDYYLNCPDPDSILIEFRLEILNRPSCKFE